MVQLPWYYRVSPSCQRTSFLLCVETQASRALCGTDMTPARTYRIPQGSCQVGIKGLHKIDPAWVLYNVLSQKSGVGAGEVGRGYPLQTHSTFLWHELLLQNMCVYVQLSCHGRHFSSLPASQLSSHRWEMSLRKSCYSQVKEGMQLREKNLQREILILGGAPM